MPLLFLTSVAGAAVLVIVIIVIVVVVVFVVLKGFVLFTSLCWHMLEAQASTRVMP